MSLSESDVHGLKDSSGVEVILLDVPYGRVARGTFFVASRFFAASSYQLKLLDSAIIDHSPRPTISIS